MANPTLVQAVVDARYADSPVPALSGIVSGNTLVAVGYAGISGQTLSISGGGLTWTSVFSYNTANYSYNVWTATASGSSVTATMTGGGATYRGLFFYEISSANGLDVTPTHSSTSGTTGISSPSQTTANNNSLVIFSGIVLSQETTYSSPSNSYTIFTQGFGLDTITYGVIQLLKATAGATSFTYNIGTFAAVQSLMLSLRAAAGGGFIATPGKPVMQAVKRSTYY